MAGLELYEDPSRAVKALTDNTNTIENSSIDPLELAERMFEIGLIKENEYCVIKDMRTGKSSDERCLEILDVFKCHVHENVIKFHRFLTLLRDAFGSIGRSLADSLDLAYHNSIIEDENKRHTAESQSSSSTSQLASKLQNILPENLSTILISFHREEDAIFSDTSSIKENQQYIHEDLAFSTSTSSMSKAYAKAFSSTTIGIGYKNSMFKELDIELPNEVRELNQMLASKMTQDVNDEDDSESFARIMDIMVPSNALRKRDHIQFSKFFQKACTGTEGDTSEHLKRMKQKPLISVPNELKVICMEVVQSLKRESDLESLSAALAYTDRNECESKSILRCRLHRRIAALHYCNGDLLDAREHLDTAIQQTELITPNVDTIYTLRLKAFILYKEYKERNNEFAYKESEQYFIRMMSHVRQQPQKMRIMTERTKINKARFHLDMIEDYRCKGKSVEAMEQLYYRAQETLQDIDLKYLTEADKKTFHTTCKEFEQYSSSFL